MEALGTASSRPLTESAGSLPGASRFALPTLPVTETPRMSPPPGREAAAILDSIFGHTQTEASGQDSGEASYQDYGEEVDMSDDEEESMREAENAGIIRLLIYT